MMSRICLKTLQQEKESVTRSWRSVKTRELARLALPTPWARELRTRRWRAGSAPRNLHGAGGSRFSRAARERVRGWGDPCAWGDPARPPGWRRAAWLLQLAARCCPHAGLAVASGRWRADPDASRSWGAGSSPISQALPAERRLLLGRAPSVFWQCRSVALNLEGKTIPSDLKVLLDPPPEAKQRELKVPLCGCDGHPHGERCLWTVVFSCLQSKFGDQ